MPAAVKKRRSPVKRKTKMSPKEGALLREKPR